MDAELSSPETTPNKQASPASPASSASSSSASSSSSSASPSPLAISNTVSNPPDQNGGSGDGDVKVDVVVSENEEEEFASGAEDFEPVYVAKEISDEVSGGEDVGGDFFPASPEFSKVEEQRPIAKLSVDDDDEEFDSAGSEVRVSEGDRETGAVVGESLVNEDNGGVDELGTEVLKKYEGFDGKYSGVLSEVIVEEEKISEGDSVVEEVKVEVLDSGTAIVGDAEGINVSEIKEVKAVDVENDFDALESVGSKSLSLESDFTENVAEESKDVEAVIEEEVSGAGSDELASKEASGEDVPKDVSVIEAVAEKEASGADSDEVIPKSLPEGEDGVHADSEAKEEKKEEAEVVSADADEVPTEDGFKASFVNGLSEPAEEDSKPSNNGKHDESDGPKPAEPESTLSREIVLEDEDEEEENGEEDREITGGSDSDEIVYGNAAKNFYKQLVRESGEMIDGQIVTDSEEEVETEEEEEDEEGEGGKEMFDSAALAALLKAATGASSDGGGNVTITSPDGSRLFSVERPAGLGMGSSLPKFAARPNHSSLFAPPTPAAGGASEEKLTDEEKKKLDKFHQVRVKYLRLVNRLGISVEESISRQVLYRLALVSGRVSSREYSVESAKETALKLEAESKDDLDFSLNLLVIGKSGVGKSATINSIFGEEKSSIHAFGPATTSVKEIVGTVDGVKIRVFDSPGLKPAAADQSYNRRILARVKSATKKCPPDIVLYVDRLDTQSRDLNDLPLLRSITSALGPAIWRSGIVTLTHAASSPPDGPTGAPLNYELFVGQRSQILQQSIGQAVGDLRAMSPSLMNPISLVENHPSCRKNRDGQKVLPNGQAWRSQLLHLCYSMKILSEASGLSKPQEAVDQRKLFGFRVRSPPLPYLLSWLLQSRTHPKLAADQGGDNGDSDIDLDDLSESEGEQEDENEFDQLPPFKPLRRTQFAKLSKDQKRAYLDEYDYRVKLLQKKQWREELRRMREMKKGGGNKLGGAGDQYDGEEDPESGAPAAVPVALPDMILPPSFDGVSPAYRYRFLEPTSQFLARPVLDTHGWDHDCGYDGVNIEHSLAVASQFPGAISVQITKDKKEFNLHLDSSIAAKHGETGSTMAGFDIQNIGKQLAYIVRGETKMKSFKRNKTAAGVSVTFLGENVSTGVKLEDQLSLGKRVVLVGSTGVVKSQSDAAYGANLEVRLREADFPIGQDQSTLGLSLVKWRGDLALGANFQSQFSLGRSYKMAVRAGLNNKLSGQISVRTSSSDQLQIALIALLPIVRSIVKLLWPESAAEGYSVY